MSGCKNPLPECTLIIHHKVNTLTDFIQICLEQARLAKPACDPNPAVGALIVGASGEILGKGYTQAPGEAHAEIRALQDAARQGHDVVGATMFVTLEPCAHQGRTGPCAHAIVRAGIAKVVASIEDPNPKVSGKGFDILLKAGVSLEVGAGATEAKAINLGFFSRFTRKTPWVRLKAAGSLDGRTALLNGQSQWITGEQAREDGHQWRARASAILTGIGTVLKDNPRLDCRFSSQTKQPLLAIVDSHLQTPVDAHVFNAKRPVIIYASQAFPDRQRALEDRGAVVVYFPDTSDRASRVDLMAVMDDLAKREVNELHVEAGARLNGALIKLGLIDEYLIYIAPKLIGPGASLADLEVLEHLSQSIDLDFLSCDLIGKDLRLVAREAKRIAF